MTENNAGRFQLVKTKNEIYLRFLVDQFRPVFRDFLLWKKWPHDGWNVFIHQSQWIWHVSFALPYALPGDIVYVFGIYNFPDEEKKNKRESWRLDCRKSIKPAKRKALFVFVPQTIYISQKENGTRFFFFFFTVSKGCANTRRQKRNFHRRRRPDSSHYVDERHYIPHSTATYTLYI
jgi:hypothetical protein